MLINNLRLMTLKGPYRGRMPWLSIREAPLTQSTRFLLLMEAVNSLLVQVS